MATAKNGSTWTQISLHPLIAPLDVRSRPADIPPGAMRWKSNFQITTEGKLCRRGGFEKAWATSLYDAYGTPCGDPNAHCSATMTDPNNPNAVIQDPGYAGVFYHNHDHHHVGATREPINFMYETTWGDGTRTLFDGTETRLSMLDEVNGTWLPDLLTGVGSFGSGCYWTAAFLQDVMIFTNDVDQVYAYPKGGAIQTIPELQTTMNVSAAKIAIEFNGCILLMNIVQDGVRQASRIIWCDLNLPFDWDQGKTGTLAGQQDLDMGDPILGAALMLGSIYIYTARKIWKCSVAGSNETVFAFQTVYSEPKNQAGCLVFPRTLVSIGAAHLYASRDGIYKFSPYIAEPVREDWIHRASGVMYTKADTKMQGRLCSAPCAEYVASKREFWISWPSGNNFVNNWSLVLQLDFQTADVVDAGFTAFCNFRHKPISTMLCNESQDFLGAAGYDYSIKSIGNVFYREYATLTNDDATNDIDLANAQYFTVGYYSELRALVPLGYTDREKRLRNVIVEDDVSEELNPCNYHCWLGNSYQLQDPNDFDDTCSVQWRDLGTKPVECVDGAAISSLTARNLRPSIAKEWRSFEQGRYLYMKLRIESHDGSEAIGADVCLNLIGFDVMALPKS